MSIINEMKSKFSTIPSWWKDYCPVCKKIAVEGCRCFSIDGKISNDRKCEDNHTWHWRNGKVVIGSHH